jgi:inorganic triphosphatase YgiF
VCNPDSTSSAQTEIETTLVICSPNPQAALTNIAGLTSIAGFGLGAPAWLLIQDFYLDTPEHELHAAKWALRVRYVREKAWITVKGPSTPRQGSLQRAEIEAEWSLQALHAVAEQLRGQGFLSGADAMVFHPSRPLQTLKSIGLVLVQDRETFRQAREIFIHGQAPQKAAAELDLDSVIYHLPGHDIHHHEVEIEARSSDYADLVEAVAQGLTAILPRTLRRWHYSKLATGKAAQKLLFMLGPEGMVENGRLTPEAYDLMEALLAWSLV